MLVNFIYFHLNHAFSDMFFEMPLQEVAETVKQDFGSIDILVHSLANGPEVQHLLLYYADVNIFA